MALGKNMKIDRLIPVAKVKKSKTDAVEQENSMELNSDGQLNPEVKEDSAQAVVSVTLDDFFDSLSDQSTVDSINVSVNNEPENTEGVIPNDVDIDGFKMFFKPSRRKTQKRILVHIEGGLTIKNSTLLSNNLKSIFQNFDYVEFNLSNISEVDLTFIQLFHHFKAFYLPLNKFLSMNADWSKEDKKMLTTCGFSEILMIN